MHATALAAPTPSAYLHRCGDLGDGFRSAFRGHLRPVTTGYIRLTMTSSAPGAGGGFFAVSSLTADAATA